MRNWVLVLLLSLAVPLILLPSAGCILFPNLFPQANGDNDGNGDTDGGDTDGGDTDGGDTDGGDTDGGDTDGGDTDGGDTDGGAAALTIVKTDIPVRFDSALRVGNNVIAFGTGAVTGVSYIVPSAAPVAGTPVTESELYRSSAFAVGGDTIFLVGNNAGAYAFHVHVFDVPTATRTMMFAETDIRLARIPVSEEDVGNIQADGDYCVVVCDPTSVTDGKILKVIDVSGAVPALISFAVNPAGSGFGVQQVAVNAASKRAVAVADDTFFIYDLNNPAAAPVEIPSANGIGDVQIRMNGNYIVAVDDQGYPQALLVDLASQTILGLTDAFAISQVDTGTNLLAFFADADASDSIGGSQRAAVGTLPGPGFAKAALDNYIDGSTTNNGALGFAGSLCIVPNDSYIFLSDSYLQYSTGTTAFVVPDDPDGADVWGCPAWDVATSANTVGFKTAATAGDSSNTMVGYIILP